MKRYRRPHRCKEKGRAEPGRWFHPPARDFYHLPDLVLRGRHIATDGCRRVLDFTPEKICLDLGDTIITFYGNGLRIESFAGQRLISSGQIRTIELRGKWEVQP